MSDLKRRLADKFGQADCKLSNDDVERLHKVLFVKEASPYSKGGLNLPKLRALCKELNLPTQGCRPLVVKQLQAWASDISVRKFPNKRKVSKLQSPYGEYKSLGVRGVKFVSIDETVANIRVLKMVISDGELHLKCTSDCDKRLRELVGDKNCPYLIGMPSKGRAATGKFFSTQRRIGVQPIVCVIVEPEERDQYVQQLIVGGKMDYHFVVEMPDEWNSVGVRKQRQATKCALELIMKHTQGMNSWKRYFIVDDNILHIDQVKPDGKVWRQIHVLDYLFTMYTAMKADPSIAVLSPLAARSFGKHPSYNALFRRSTKVEQCVCVDYKAGSTRQYQKESAFYERFMPTDELEQSLNGPIGIESSEVRDKVVDDHKAVVANHVSKGEDFDFAAQFVVDGYSTAAIALGYVTIKQAHKKSYDTKAYSAVYMTCLLMSRAVNKIFQTRVMTDTGHFTRLSARRTSEHRSSVRIAKKEKKKKLAILDLRRTKSAT